MGKTITTGFINATINSIKVNSSKKCNADNYTNKSSRKVDYIVIHYTGNKKDEAWANANYFQSPSRGASAHFFVDDREIYQSIELRDVAWHCGANTYYHNYCRNSNSIGIEMCCTAGNYKVSKTTITNTAYLTAYLCKQLGISALQVDQYVLRHYDVTHKLCPAQMVDNSKSEDKDWVAFKKQVKEILGETANKITTTTSTTGFKPYVARITADVLNVRSGAGTKYKIVTTVKENQAFTIVEEKNGWGKLKSGAGWICLDYTKKVK